MKIVLLATTEQKEELVAAGQDMSAELIWPAELTSAGKIADADACIDLLFDNTAERIKKLRQLQTQIVIISSVVIPLNELTASCIRINGWPTFLKRPIIETAGDDKLKNKAEQVFALFNKKVEWVADIAGFIAARVVASVINEAYYALEEQVSTKEEIDTAMKLGTNYPYGPFEWSEKIGINNIYTLLDRLSEEQKRYKPSALLTKEATD